MCGIAGIYNYRDSCPVDLSRLKGMAAVQVHRGPDDEGFYAHGPVGLAHRRLSIIDREGGHQPMFNGDGSVAIVFNGEIYNHMELRRDLEPKGHVFRTRSDTESIIHAYEGYGDVFQRRLTGMFAFALWDSRRRRLVLSRDRLGIKPLYYAFNRGQIIFASEIKALLTMEGVEPRVNPDSLEAYLNLRYVPGPLTMFKDIFKLQPGHTMTVENGQVSIRSYWDIEFGEQPRNEQQAADEFEALLHDVCRSHLMSEVPYGVLLSGGVDSSAILAVLRSVLKEGVTTFTVGYKGSETVSEFNYARLVSSPQDGWHHELELHAEDFAAWIPKLVWHLDEPVGDPACIPLYFLARYAKSHATVLHSGEGADEILAGYSIYNKMQMMSRLQSSLLSPLVRAVGQGMEWFDGHSKSVHYLRLLSQPLEGRYRGVSGHFMNGYRDALVRGSSLCLKPDGTYWTNTFADYFGRVKTACDLNRMLYVDMKAWLPDDLLVKADKMTMAASVELRVPFLDHRLVEFAARLPATYKLRGGQSKYLLRKVMKRYLPRQVIHRTKMGFPVPVAAWLQNGLYSLASEVLLNPHNALSRYFNLDQIRNMLLLHRSRQVNLGDELWGLLVLEYWFQEFKVQS